METGSYSVLMWVTWSLGALPFLWFLLKWWNEILYVFPVNLRSKYSRAKLPPGSMGVPFLGELITFLWYFKFTGRPDDYINSKRKKYGGDGVFKTHLFGSPSIISCVPAVNKFVMQNIEDFRVKWPTEEVMGSHSLISVHGKPYERIRKLVGTTANDPNALRRIVLRVQPRVVAGLESWAEKGRVLVHHEVRKLTFENIGKLFVSLDPGPLLDEMKLLFAGVMDGVRANPIKFPGTAYHHGLQCKNRLEEIFYADLETKKKNQATKNEADYDLMDGLMNIQDEAGNRLSDAEVVDNTMALVFAGFESTSTASTWAVYYLAKYPDVLKKLREENIALSEKKKGEPITFEDVSSLKYTNKVVEETLRMANVAAFVFRTVMKDTEYKGYKFPKGWKVILWLRYFQTNPENFDDPLTFNPDRWDEPAKPWTYQVFGGGPRTCAGNMLARIQMAILIHHLTIGYKWELVNPDSGVVYLPHPRPSDHLAVNISRL